MRRETMVAVALLASVAALPPSASARPRSLPGLLGAITSPIGAILGAGRHIGRGRRLAHHTPRHTRTVADRPMPAAAAAATAAVPAAGAAASTPASSKPAHEANSPESVTKAGTNGDQPAKPAVAATAEPVSSQAGSAHAEVPPTITTTASAPAGPASAQRNAALALPNDELRGRVTDPSRAAKPTPTSSHLGLDGPLTWPSAFEDVIGYTLWPAQYSERLRTHGIADVLGAVFVSPATLAAKARANNVQAKVDNAGGAAVAAGACANATTAPSEWPVSEIERSIELTAAQRSALDQLKASLDSAIGSIASTCRDTADLGPTERLQAMQATLWAVHDAALLIRAPLAAFYDSLTDEQKKKFAAAPTEEANAHGMSRSEAARMCGMPASLESSMQRIERSVQTTKAQRASLDALDKKSFEMGQFLMASCLKPLPGTPAERLDAAADRLTAVLFAASNLGPAIGDFYGQLSDEQKAKLKKLR